MLPFFQGLEQTSIATAIRGTTWFMPLTNTVHALGMTLLIGSIIVISLRLLGIAMKSRPVSDIAADVWPAATVGVIIMLITGLLLFLPESVRWYGSIPFRVKMSFLFLAILFHFTVFRRIAQGAVKSSAVCRTTGVVALVLWFGVGFGGRAITFLE